MPNKTISEIRQNILKKLLEAPVPTTSAKELRVLSGKLKSEVIAFEKGLGISILANSSRKK